MNFSVELWNSYEFVSNNLQLHLRGLRDFIFLLREKHSSEIQLTHGLQKISQSNLAITNLESLYEGIKGFKSDMNNQSNYIAEFCLGIEEELIQPAEKLMTRLTERTSKQNVELSQVEREYFLSVDQAEKAKQRFHLSAKETETNMLNTEACKLNLSLAQEVKVKNERRTQDLLKIAKEMEKSYVIAVEHSNELREDYIELKKSSLNSCQEMEEAIGEFIKDALRKYIVFQVSYLRNMQYDIERKAKLMDSITIKNDIKKLIGKHSTNDLPPFKVEFIPYMSDYEATKKELDAFPIQEETKQSIRRFISNVFFSEAPPDVSPSASKLQSEIEVIVNSIYQSKAVPSKANKLIAQFIQSKKSRRALLKTMNQMRLKGVFTLSALSYQTIGDILLQCLNVLIKEKDVEALRLCISLAQTLYKSATEANKPRVFLQSYINSHLIWRTIAVWKELIKGDVIEEMHNQKSYNIYKQESPEGKNKRIKEIIHNSLNSFIYNMISFEVSPNFIREIIEDYHRDSEISDEDKLSFEEVIVEYESGRNEKTKDEIKEEPSSLTQEKAITD